MAKRVSTLNRKPFVPWPVYQVMGAPTVSSYWLIFSLGKRGEGSTSAHLFRLWRLSMNWPCSIVDLCLNNDIGRFYSFDLPPTREPCPTPPVVYRVLPAESMLTLVNCGAVVYACIFVCVLLRMPACFRYDRACVCVFMTRPVSVCLS